MSSIRSPKQSFESLIPQIKAVGVWDYPAKEDVVRRAVLYARRAFGPNTYFIEQIKEVEFEGIAFAIGGGPPGPSAYDRKTWEAGKRNLINIIELILEEFEEDKSKTWKPVVLPERSERPKETEPSFLHRRRLAQEATKEITTDEQSDRVFVVHGHDEAMKERVARTIFRLKLKPIILHEQPNRGRTIIEKFEEEASDIGFAVVLLSPDDEGQRRGEDALRPRARQNVVLELGFFYGQLGRGRVFALYRDMEDFDLPSDISGVIYVPFDKAGAWKMDLYRELKDNGYTVNADDIM